MTKAELEKFDGQNVRVRLIDGTIHEGHLRSHDKHEAGLFHVMPRPRKPGRIEGGILDDIHAEDVESVEAL
jgi:hypothetical protein